MLPALAKAARTLGPKGLMPNPKRGSVTAEIGDAVRRAKGGEVTFAELLRWLQVSENRAALGEKSGLGEESAIALPQDKAEPTPGNHSTLIWTVRVSTPGSHWQLPAPEMHLTH